MYAYIHNFYSCNTVPYNTRSSKNC